jgi:hypothetical protein
MATQAEMRAEELVYEVAEELGLTEDEVLDLDVLALAAGALRRLRIDVKKHAGRPLTVRDYRPPTSRPAIVVGIEALLEDPVEA